ncbi:MAG: hypothetical protein KDD60_05395 [Bdellovibrionales bacterium]|nr:hypothetical protein [Bdellovibrionales bacterium]
MRLHHVSTIILSVCLLCGCSSHEFEEPAQVRVYSIADRQLPRDPVYSRLRWVHLPEMHPARHVEVNPERPLLLPVNHFSIQDKPLCDAAALLAGSARYSAYCSSLLKDEKISLEALGTIDEIATLIEKNSQARVIVDHSNREVRFLLGTEGRESFYSDGGTANEH